MVSKICLVIGGQHYWRECSGGGTRPLVDGGVASCSAGRSSPRPRDDGEAHSLAGLEGERRGDGEAALGSPRRPSKVGGADLGEADRSSPRPPSCRRNDGEARLGSPRRPATVSGGASLCPLASDLGEARRKVCSGGSWRGGSRGRGAVPRFDLEFLLIFRFFDSGVESRYWSALPSWSWRPEA